MSTVASEAAVAADYDVPDSFAGLLSRLTRLQAADPRVSALVDKAAEVWSRPGFDTFLCLPYLAFAPFDYQLQTVRTVLRQMRGRAILADEVGLGKTIEAGLILSELRLRGLADRALVITPAGLVEQWREELERKFGLPTAVAQGAGWKSTLDRPVVLASIAAARRDPLKRALTGGQWDVVIADEAHRLRSPRSASGRLARISLVAPGLLGTPTQFRGRYAGVVGNPRTPRNVAELRARTREVMVRHRRSEVSLMLPQRLAETVLVAPHQQEAALYADLMARIRARVGTASGSQLLVMRGLARLAGSSPAAAAQTLAKLGWHDLAERAGAPQCPRKVQVLVERLRRHVERGEKVLVFTSFRRTLQALADQVDRAGLPAAVYHGSLPRQEKERAVAAFRDEVPVLLSTESAGEGRNLQFCHVMVNVDLPWNPMQIEQRLGRLHRVGQERDVLLTNLVTGGTIEQRILRVLEAKINLFELVVGELDMILGRVDDEFDFETSVFDAFVAAGDDEQFEQMLEVIGDRLAGARKEYLDSRASVDALVGEDGP